MTSPAQPDILFAAEDLRAQVTTIFSAIGSDAPEAALVTDHLVLANLFGHDSHGISLIPLYVRMVREGKVEPNQRPTAAMDNGALLTLDGHRGFGQAVAHEAMEIGIARARERGVAIIALRNSHHVGRIGHYAEQCCRAGLVSMHYVNVVGTAPVVAPFAGIKSRLHTNPVAIGVPREGADPLVLDFATSRAAQGKIRVAMNRGVPVPPGFLLDADGEPTTDARVVYDEPVGTMLPFGEHKGSGLGLLCDVLAGALTGGRMCHPGSSGDDVYLNNMLSVMIDPDRLGGRETWQQEIALGTQFFTSSLARDPAMPILLPGEPERATRARRDAEGIPVDATTWRLIRAAAAGVGVALPEAGWR